MSELLVGLLSGAGLATVAASVITGLFTRRQIRANASNLDATAAEAIQRASKGLVEDLRRQVADERADHDREIAEVRADLERVKASWAQEREATRRVLQLHVAFDQLAIAKLAEAGIDLGMQPPPLLPPLREDI